jgi:hypothetical protein
VKLEGAIEVKIYGILSCSCKNLEIEGLSAHGGSKDLPLSALENRPEKYS